MTASDRASTASMAARHPECWRYCLPSPLSADSCLAPESAETVRPEGPAGRLGGDPPPGFQDVAGDGELVGRGCEYLRGVVEDEAPSSHSDAQASARCMRSIHHLRTGDRAIRSLRRASVSAGFREGPQEHRRADSPLINHVN